MVRGQIASSYRPHSRLELLSTLKALDIVEIAKNDVCGDSLKPVNCSFIARVVMLQVDQQRISSHFWEPVESLNG